jgi:ubiquinone/menaquinone biosynthesis C-methylase UbiE
MRIPVNFAGAADRRKLSLTPTPFPLLCGPFGGNHLCRGSRIRQRRILVMGVTADEARGRAAKTYNAAADAFDDPANSFWERFGRRTIDRLHLQPGMRVLDVCCGSGASAIPAAEKVGPEGFVLGVDLAENLLERARSKATRRELQNLEFRVGDMLDLSLERSEFDAVVCVFGIFFVPDMRAGVRALWQVVRPGGKLAITTWGPRWFEPATTAFWNAIREVRPDLYKGFNPWDRICARGLLRRIAQRSSGAVPL